MINKVANLSNLFRRIILIAVWIPFPIITFGLMYMAWTGEQIRAHGLRIEAQLIDSYANCGKHGCDEIVDYRFQPYGTKKYLRSHGTIGKFNSNNPNVGYVGMHHSIPIAYDAQQPEMSNINFDDQAMRPMPLGLLIVDILLIAFSLFLSVGFAFILLRKNPNTPNSSNKTVHLV